MFQLQIKKKYVDQAPKTLVESDIKKIERNVSADKHN